MCAFINQEFSDFFKSYVNENWPDKRVRSHFPDRSRNTSRFIQVSTELKGMSIHYEYTCDKVEFHIEGEFTKDLYADFRKYLREAVLDSEQIFWYSCHSTEKCYCTLRSSDSSWNSAIEGISKMISMFDPVIEKYVAEHNELFPNLRGINSGIDLSYQNTPSVINADVAPCIIPIKDLPYDCFVIPPYQRPYKWSAKNVNQLVNDIIAFKECKQYRLGTLVLHNNEIVDGQQRIITLALLIKQLAAQISDKNKKDTYNELFHKVDLFCESTTFHNRYSLHNIIENIHAIETRIQDFDDSLIDFVLQKCEFVIISLNDISEAFQFFDSQNARGKDLSPHDLLKAYHLREIFDLSPTDSENIDCWESQGKKLLSTIFLSLFRTKRWSQGKTARYFTKDDIGIFKGISLSEGKRYPFYQLEIIAHIFTEMYKNDPTRVIDKSNIEFPFNLDDQIINGSRFFDLCRHYIQLYKDIKETNNFSTGQARRYLSLLDGYDGSWRSGDNHIISMLYTLILYYIDRFGWDELDKVIPKFFIWAYSLRLQNYSIQLATIDNYATRNDSMFRYVHDAKTPFDIINIYQESLKKQDIRCSRCTEIVQAFKDLNKYSDEQ